MMLATEKRFGLLLTAAVLLAPLGCFGSSETAEEPEESVDQIEEGFKTKNGHVYTLCYWKTATFTKDSGKKVQLFGNGYELAPGVYGTDSNLGFTQDYFWKDDSGVRWSHGFMPNPYNTDKWMFGKIKSSKLCPLD